MAATGKRHFPHTTPDTAADAVYQEITAGAAHVVGAGGSLVTAGNYYIGRGYDASLASNWSHVQIHNATGSGVTVYVDAITLYAQAATQDIKLFQYDTVLDEAQGGSTVNKYFGSANTPQATIKTKTQVTKIGATDAEFFSVQMANGTGNLNRVYFPEPIVLQENTGLIVRANSTDQHINATFEWHES